MAADVLSPNVIVQNAKATKGPIDSRASSNHVVVVGGGPIRTTYCSCLKMQKVLYGF
jgi:hypothetical protein